MSTTLAFSFAGRHALVTGGASGIGEVTAALLVSLGAKVAIADRNGAELPAAKARSGAQLAIEADVTREEDTERMAEEARAALGGLDILVNSAGVGDDLVALHEQKAERWREIADINLWGTYLACRAASRTMLAAGRGSIVNISSIVGLGAFPGRSAYGVAKAGVIHLTKTLAVEWGRAGIRVNAVAPAYTKTPMVASLLQRRMFDPTVLERRTPLGRMAETEEVARAIVFLASDWASYVTGTVLPVDGGWSIYAAAGDLGAIRAPRPTSSDEEL